MGGVFISCRREDSQGTTGEITDRRHERLGGCVARSDDAVGIPYRFSSCFVGGFRPDEDRWRDGQGAAIATTGSTLGSGN